MRCIYLKADLKAGAWLVPPLAEVDRAEAALAEHRRAQQLVEGDLLPLRPHGRRGPEQRASLFGLKT